MTKFLTNKSGRGILARIALCVAVLFAVGAASACGEDQLKVVAENTDRLALLIKDGREIRDELEAQGIIGADEARAITVGLLKTNSALKAFNNRAATYKAAGALTPEGKALLVSLATDITEAAAELVSDGTFGVKNPEAQRRINAALRTIKALTVAIVDAVTAFKTKPAVQTAGLEGLASLGSLLIAQVIGFLAREKARTGKTSDEILADAASQIAENESALTEDLARYNTAEGVDTNEFARE